MHKLDDIRLYIGISMATFSIDHLLSSSKTSAIRNGGDSTPVMPHNAGAAGTNTTPLNHLLDLWRLAIAARIQHGRKYRVEQCARNLRAIAAQMLLPTATTSSSAAATPLMSSLGASIIGNGTTINSLSDDDGSRRSSARRRREQAESDGEIDQSRTEPVFTQIIARLAAAALSVAQKSHARLAPLSPIINCNNWRIALVDRSISQCRCDQVQFAFLFTLAHRTAWS